MAYQLFYLLNSLAACPKLLSNAQKCPAIPSSAWSTAITLEGIEPKWPEWAQIIPKLARAACWAPSVPRACTRRQHWFSIAVCYFGHLTTSSSHHIMAHCCGSARRVLVNSHYINELLFANSFHYGTEKWCLKPDFTSFHAFYDGYTRFEGGTDGPPLGV